MKGDLEKVLCQDKVGPAAAFMGHAQFLIDVKQKCYEEKRERAGMC